MSVAPLPVGITGERLLDREREREVLDRLLAAARGGHGGVLVIAGAPGVGKTALLEHAGGAAQELRLLRTAAVEGEMEPPYAALQQLWAPISDLMEALPPPQREAL